MGKEAFHLGIIQRSQLLRRRMMAVVVFRRILHRQHPFILTTPQPGRCRLTLGFHYRRPIHRLILKIAVSPFGCRSISTELGNGRRRVLAKVGDYFARPFFQPFVG